MAYLPASESFSILNLSIDFTSLLETGRYGYYLLFF